MLQSGSQSVATASSADTVAMSPGEAHQSRIETLRSKRLRRLQQVRTLEARRATQRLRQYQAKQAAKSNKRDATLRNEWEESRQTQVRALEEKLRKSLRGVGEAHRSAVVAEDKHHISKQEQRRIDNSRAQDAAQRHTNALVVAKELRESLPLHCAAVAGETRNRVRIDSASAQRQAAKARADVAREEKEAERIRQAARIRALEHARTTMAYVVRAEDHVVTSGSIIPTLNDRTSAANGQNRMIRTAVVAHPNPGVLLQQRPDGTSGEGDETVLRQTDGFKSARVFARAQGIENQMQQRRTQQHELDQVERSKAAARRVVAEQDVERLNEQLSLVQRAENQRKLEITKIHVAQGASRGGSGGGPWKGHKVTTTKDVQLAKLVAEKRLEAAFEREFMVASPPLNSTSGAPEYNGQVRGPATCPVRSSATPMSAVSVESPHKDTRSRFTSAALHAGISQQQYRQQQDEQRNESVSETDSSLGDSRVTYTSEEGGGGWHQLQPMTPPAPTPSSATLSSQSRDSSRVSSPAILANREQTFAPGVHGDRNGSIGGHSGVATTVVEEDELAVSGARERAALIGQSFTAALETGSNRSSIDVQLLSTKDDVRRNKFNCSNSKISIPVEEEEEEEEGGAVKRTARRAGDRDDIGGSEYKANARQEKTLSASMSSSFADNAERSGRMVPSQLSDFTPSNSFVGTQQNRDSIGGATMQSQSPFASYANIATPAASSVGGMSARAIFRQLDESMRLFVDDGDDTDDEDGYINGGSARDEVNAEWRNETDRRFSSRAKREGSSKISIDQHLTSIPGKSGGNNSEKPSIPSETTSKNGRTETGHRKTETEHRRTETEHARTESKRTRTDLESRTSDSTDDAGRDGGSDVDSIVLGQQQPRRRERAVSQELVDMARDLAWTLRTTESAMASVSMGMSMPTASGPMSQDSMENDDIKFTGHGQSRQSALLSSVSASSGNISEGDLRSIQRNTEMATTHGAHAQSCESETEGSSSFGFSEIQIGTARGRVIAVGGRGERGELDNILRTTMTTSGTGTTDARTSRSSESGKLISTGGTTSRSGVSSNGGRLRDYSAACDSLGDSMGMISLPSGMSSLSGGDNDDGDSWSSNFDLNALTRSVERVLREGERDGAASASASAFVSVSTSQRQCGGYKEGDSNADQSTDSSGRQRISEYDRSRSGEDVDVLVEDDAWRGDSDLADLAGRVEAMLAGGDEEETKINVNRVRSVHSRNGTGSSEGSSRSGSSAAAGQHSQQQQQRSSTSRASGDEVNVEVLVEDAGWRGHAELADVAGQVEAMLRGSAASEGTSRASQVHVKNDRTSTSLPPSTTTATVTSVSLSDGTSEYSRRRRDDTFLSLSNMSDTSATAGDGESRTAHVGSGSATDAGVSIHTEDQLSFDELETRLNHALKTLTDTSTVVLRQQNRGEEEEEDYDSNASTARSASHVSSLSSYAAAVGGTQLNSREYGEAHHSQERRKVVDLTVVVANDNASAHATEGRDVTGFSQGTTHTNTSTQESEESWQHMHAHAVNGVNGVDVNTGMDDTFLGSNNTTDGNDDDFHVSVSQSASPSAADVQHTSSAPNACTLRNTRISYDQNYVDVDSSMSRSEVFLREGDRSAVRIASAENILNAQPNNHCEGTSNSAAGDTSDTGDTRSVRGSGSRTKLDSSFERHIGSDESSREGNQNEQQERPRSKHGDRLSGRWKNEGDPNHRITNADDVGRSSNAADTSARMEVGGDAAAQQTRYVEHGRQQHQYRYNSGGVSAPDEEFEVNEEVSTQKLHEEHTNTAAQYNSGDHNMNMALSPDSAHNNNNSDCGSDGADAYMYDDDEFEDEDTTNNNSNNDNRDLIMNLGQSGALTNGNVNNASSKVAYVYNAQAASDGVDVMSMHGNIGIGHGTSNSFGQNSPGGDGREGDGVSMSNAQEEGDHELDSPTQLFLRNAQDSISEVQHDIDEILAVSESSFSSGNNSSGNTHFEDDNDELNEQEREYANEYVEEHDGTHDTYSQNEQEHTPSEYEQNNGGEEEKESSEVVLRRVHGLVGIIDYEIDSIDNTSAQYSSLYAEMTDREVGVDAGILGDSVAPDARVRESVRVREEKAHEEQPRMAIDEAIDESHQQPYTRGISESHANNSSFRIGVDVDADDDDNDRSAHGNDDDYDIAAAAVINATFSEHLSSHVLSGGWGREYRDDDDQQLEQGKRLDEQLEEQLEGQQLGNSEDLLDTTERTEKSIDESETIDAIEAIDVDDRHMASSSSSLMTSPTIAHLSAAGEVMLETAADREQELHERNDDIHGSSPSFHFGSFEHSNSQHSLLNQNSHSEHTQQALASSSLSPSAGETSLPASPTAVSMHEIHQEISPSVRAIVGREQQVANVTVTMPGGIEPSSNTLQTDVPAVVDETRPVPEGGEAEGASAYYIGSVDDASAATTSTAEATRMRLEQRSRQRAAKVRAAAAEAKAQGDSGGGSKSVTTTRGGRVSAVRRNTSSRIRPLASVNSSSGTTATSTGEVQSAVSMPPPELMARLSQGERARVSREETSERTQRLYLQLPEVRARREREEKEAKAKKRRERVREEDRQRRLASGRR